MWSQLLRKQGGCIRYCTVRIVSQALYELCSWTIGAKSSPKMNSSGDKHQQDIQVHVVILKQPKLTDYNGAPVDLH